MTTQKKKKASEKFFTTGQTAKLLRISVSTLKRWVHEESVLQQVKKNSNGWKLFSEWDVNMLRQYQKQKKKMGRVYKASTLRPVEH